MSNISALHIGNSSYNIDAEAARKVLGTNTELSAVEGSAAAASAWINTNGTNVINSAKSGYAASAWLKSNTDGTSAKYAKSATNAYTVTGHVPSALSWSGVSAEVDKKIGTAIGGVYQIQGDASWSSISANNNNKKNGYVYNITGGVDSNSKDKNNNVISVGDNVVYVTAGTAGWDKLASTIDTSTFVKTGTSVTLTASNATNLANVAGTAVTASAAGGSAASAWINTNGTNITNSAKSGYAASAWIKTNGTNITNSAKSGYAASAYINAHESEWTNQSAYSVIRIYSAAGAQALVTSAGNTTDTFGFSASNNISLTATTDVNGNPIIAISAKDTTYTIPKTYTAFGGDTGTVAATASNDTLKITGANGIYTSAVNNAAANKDVITISGIPATTATYGVNKASYIADGIAYLF